MAAFRADRSTATLAGPALALSLGLGVFLGGVEPAFAQSSIVSPPPGTDGSAVPGTGAPGVQTAPAQQPQRQGPVILRPRRDVTGPAVDSTGTTLPSATIRSETLERIDKSAVGTLSPGQGGFGIRMWEGTPRDVIDRLVPAIPREIPSSTLRALARRLLLSVAAVPSRLGDAGDSAADTTLIAARIDRLMAMGALDDAKALWQVAPGRQTDPELARLEVERRLIEADYPAACAEAQQDQSRLVRPFWQALLAFCQALAGDRSAAELGISLLAETPDFEDKATLALLARVNGDKRTKIDSLPNPTPLQYAMLKASDAPLPEDAGETAGPAILAAVAADADTKFDLRLALGERAARLGALDSVYLATIYLDVPFQPDALDTALQHVETLEDESRGRALLYQAAQRPLGLRTRGQIIGTGLELARQQEAYSYMLTLYEPLIRRFGFSDDLTGFAPQAARAYYALGRPFDGQPWLSLLARRASIDSEAADAVDAFWALRHLVGAEGGPFEDPAVVDAWVKTVWAKGDGAERRVAMALALFEGLGWDIPAQYASLRDPGDLDKLKASADLAQQRALENAAQNERLAETVLWSLEMIGEVPPRRMDIEQAQDVVQALRLAGLGDEARALAIEIAIAVGL